jgi:hypothetical protein
MVRGGKQLPPTLERGRKSGRIVLGRPGLARTFGLLSRGSQVRVLPGANLLFSEGLCPSDSPARSLARRFDGALPPTLKLRRDLAEAPTARRRAVRVAHSLRSFASHRSFPGPTTRLI